LFLEFSNPESKRTHIVGLPFQQLKSFPFVDFCILHLSILAAANWLESKGRSRARRMVQMEKLVNHCDMELMKMAMLRHEQAFRQQVHARSKKTQVNSPLPSTMTLILLIILLQ